MGHNTVIDMLLAERIRVLAEKDAAIQQFNAKIGEIEGAIEELGGGKVWEMNHETVYDDEHPDYIKQSAEEM